MLSLICYLIFVALPLCGGESESPEEVEKPLGASTLHYCFPREPIKGNKIPTTRTMIMIFDDSERGINTLMTNTLASALYQITNETPPQSEYCILTSASLLQNIIAAREFAQSVYQKLVQKIQVSTPNFNSTSMVNIEELQNLKDVVLTSKDSSLLHTPIFDQRVPDQLALYTFKPEHWHMYEVNQFLYLLIPKHLAEKEDTYRLGLKIDQLEKVSYEELTKKLLNITDQQKKSSEIALNTIFAQQRPKLNLYSFRGTFGGLSAIFLGDAKTPIFVTPAAYAEKSTNNRWISSLFVTREEYQKENKLAEIPQWAFYVQAM